MVIEIDKDESILWDCRLCGETDCKKPECKTKYDYYDGVHGSNSVEIFLLEAPGVEDTKGGTVKHASKIIYEMAKVVAFSLIIVIFNSKDLPSK
ncbi:hypothetical protein BG006_000961, partial [Podila minutissima]